MTFFTGLGIFIMTLLGYIMLVAIGVILMPKDDEGYFGALFAGMIISLLLAAFICDPEQFGYQKITVSENVVEATE